MESYIIIFISLCLSFLVRFILTLLLSPSPTTTENLPPGPSTFHLLTNILWRRKSFFELGPVISTLRKKYGPIITVKMGSHACIFISDNTLAHEALVNRGAVFADRPETTGVDLIFPVKRKGINQSRYGTRWRVLRRNLTCSSGVLHPSRIKSYSHLRERVLENLICELKHESEFGDGDVCVYESLKHAIFSLLVLICFGNNVEENKIRELEDAQNRFCLIFRRVSNVVFAIIPNFGKILFRKSWKEFVDVIKCKENILVSLIRERKKIKQENEEKDIDSECYVDTLFDLRLPGDQHKILEESEIMNLSDEFISGGTEKMTTALQWIMANIVKYPKVQAKILVEMKGILQKGQRCIKGKDVYKLPYLQAVILEGLRRHPPVYLPGRPHAVTEDVELGGYRIPQGMWVNFMVADMGRDPNAWESPLEFKPERFSCNNNHNDNDIGVTASSREIKMMPFGAGRRICPGLDLAILDLEYFVANLVWKFEWNAVDDDVDLSEKVEFTITGMKKPLRARVSPRRPRD
ncbi:putative Cytochrome P450 [Melia azedarach]|uniref:Cytochrome P450 n=1 Tax=Melia azedarach TaxID=155640 RepID=A0ACC1X8C5_MELAZ|nr:putative Cytochrome P450 [Melia azedarach]